MSDKLILYRGDFTAIDEFKFKKTRSHCLVGQGIYLTNSEKVADTYRTKGSCQSGSHNKETLFQGLAENRLDAYKQGFIRFLHYHDYHSLVRKLPKLNEHNKANQLCKQEAEDLKQMKVVYQELIDSGKIVAEYISREFVKGHKEIKVIYHHGNSVGHLSSFAFDRKSFNTAMLQIDYCRDPVFWELMWDNQIKFGTPYSTKERYISANTIYRYNITDHSSRTFNEIRLIIQPYGYRGFEYGGGLITSGIRTHRAFCVWDEEWVNEHRIYQAKADHSK